MKKKKIRDLTSPLHFFAAHIARGPTNNETHEDRLVQTLVDMQEGNVEAGSGENESEQETGDSEDESRGIDLMASDDGEDEEEI